MKQKGWLLLLAGIVVVGVWWWRNTAVSAPRPITPSPNKLGIHLLLDDGRSHWPAVLWPEHMQYAQTAVGEGGYITQLIRLDDLDPAKWQQFMDLCAELQLIPIVRLATTYNQQTGWWEKPPMDENGRSYHTTAQQYATFITSLHWPTAEHYVVVGNEPNHGEEWGGRPNPAAYAQFLLDTANALHTADSAVRVLNAGLDTYTPHTGSQPFVNGLWYMDAETFMDEMVAAHPTIFSSLDGWASHPYPPGPFLDAPWQQTYQVDWLNDATNPHHQEPPPGIFNRGINSYEWELWKLATYGVPPLPVFITETGWRHGEGYPTVEEVTVYLDLAVRGNNGRYPHHPQTGWTPWLQDERVVAVTPFALNGSPGEWEHTNWLQLNAAGHILGSYAMMEVWHMPPP